MVKYIDAERLKAEIERRIEFWTKREKYALPGQDKDTCQSRVTELTDLLSFIDSLQQEQSEVLSGEDVMTMCNQILIDWVKEGKTKEEKEQREQAHIRFFELYDDYLMQEQLEVDLEKVAEGVVLKFHPIMRECYAMNLGMYEMIEVVKSGFELGFNARKEE